MRFLLFCPITRVALQNRLGSAEYSYRFVLEGFRPLLEKIGEVIEVENPEHEADKLHDEAKAAGRTCRLICFCPPNLAPVDLRCPTTVVLAWEFDTIPTEPWDDNPKNDWRTVLSSHGQAITLSSHSRRAVEDALGDKCRVSVIPVPLHKSQAREFEPTNRAPGDEIVFRGHMIDSQDLLHSHDLCLPVDTLPIRSDKLSADDVVFSFSEGSEEGACLLGFYDPEAWGVWSRVENPAIILACPLWGTVELHLNAVAYGRNVGREIFLLIDGKRFPLSLTETPTIYKITVSIKSPTNLLRIGPLDIEPLPEAIDNRSMGIGLVSLRIKRIKSLLPRLLQRLPLIPPKQKLDEPRGRLHLSGVVFTSVFNPRDGRKNWDDIVSAFCYALGDRTDATLVLKVTHFSPIAYCKKFFELMAAIGPVRARIVVVNAFLDSGFYRQLIKATNWYVNASRGEGLCLPLMEFMTAGVPAIAPKHTAMEDYIDEASALIVRSNRTPTRWPNDPIKRNGTRWHDIDWKSLVDCFTEAHAIATRDTKRYVEMGSAAASKVASYASEERIQPLLQKHFQEAD